MDIRTNAGPQIETLDEWLLTAVEVYEVLGPGGHPENWQTMHFELHLAGPDESEHTLQLNRHQWLGLANLAISAAQRIPEVAAGGFEPPPRPV